MTVLQTLLALVLPPLLLLLWVVVQSAWQRQFGAEESLVGDDILLDGNRTTVAGVMPPSFRFPDPATEFWVPQVIAAAAQFGAPDHEPDALAVRGNCGQCGCSEPCDWRTSNE